MGRLLGRLYDRPYLLLTLTMLFWSGNFVLGRAVHATVPPVALAFWRWMGAFLIVLGFAWPHLRRDWPTMMRSWRMMLLLSLTGIATFNALSYAALAYTTAINGLILQSSMPLMIVLFSFALFGDRIGWPQALGLLLSLAGVTAIVCAGDPAMLLALSLNRGDLLILIGIAAYALYSALLRRRPRVHGVSFLAASFLLGSLMLLPFVVVEHAMGRPLDPTDTTTLLAIGYVAVFPSLLAYFCFNRGVELIGANRAGHFMHLLPVFGAILSALTIGERFQLYHAAGMALIVGGIVIASLDATPRR